MNLLNLAERIVTCLEITANSFSRFVTLLENEQGTSKPCKSSMACSTTPAIVEETPEPAAAPEASPKTTRKPRAKATPAAEPENATVVDNDPEPEATPEEIPATVDLVPVSLEIVRAMAIELFGIGRDLGPEKEAESRADWNKLREACGVNSLANATPAQLVQLHDGLDVLIKQWKTVEE